MFDGIVPIDSENVAATVDDIQERLIKDKFHLDPDADTSTLGSTGKKLPGETSGDIDIAIDYARLQDEWDLPYWTGKRIEEWVDLASGAAEELGYEFNMAATVCSIKWPIVNDDGRQEDSYIQVDLMPTTNMKMMRFGRFSQQQKPDETYFKGTIRNIMLACMASASYHKDLTEDTHEVTLDDGTKKDVHNEYEGWTYDGNSGLHLCHKKYEQYTRNGKGFVKGDWKPHASVVSSPVISSDPDEIVEMIFGKGVTPDDVDTVQKMWRAWKSAPAVKENPDLIKAVRERIEKNAKQNPEMVFPDFDGEEFINEGRNEIHAYNLKDKEGTWKPDQNNYRFKNRTDSYGGDDYITADEILHRIHPMLHSKFGDRNWFTGPGCLDYKKSNVFMKVDDGSDKKIPITGIQKSKEYGKVAYLLSDGGSPMNVLDFSYKLDKVATPLGTTMKFRLAYMNKDDESVYVCNRIEPDGNDVIFDMEWGDLIDYSEELLEEARSAKTPEQKVQEHLDALTDEQKEKLTLRCVELLDRWSEEASDDPVKQVWDYMGSQHFSSMLRKIVPLKEPALRDMGANTFVAKFFDIPFDAEAYLGKIAKEQGIPYAQAEEEWTRSNLDKTHVGRYAHMLAHDAIEGNPPSKEGTNVKECAVYKAIYDYARNLVEGATDVESEVTLSASDVNVGGKFDLMMKNDGQWVLVDWKTNGEDLDDVPNGKVGIDELTKNINNNSYNKYALQLNVYEWAAKHGGRIPMDAPVRKELHHFRYDEGKNIVDIKVIQVPDLQELVSAMVERAKELGVIKSK